MRDIKFRAWDNFLSYYSRNSKELYYQASGIFGISTGDRYILEQFTGLPDKNGKEIYEGDIILVHYDQVADVIGGSNRYETIGVSVLVKWSIDSWRVEVDGEQFSLSEWNESSAVIGNIHENPKLLKEAKNVS